MRRWVKIATGIAALGVVAIFAAVPVIVEKGRNRVVPHDPWPVSDAARALHERLVIGDWHSDALLWDRNLLERSARGHVDLPRLRDGNVAIQVFTTVTKSPKGQNYSHNDTDAADNITPLVIAQLRPPRSWFNLTERALDQAARLERFAQKTPEQLQIIRTRNDLATVLSARAEGAQIVGGLLGAEGAHALSGDLANLDRMYEAGFRLIGLTHFFDNELGGSLHGEGGTGAGLTEFGRQVVAQMIARDIIIDLAHASPQMARDVLAIDAARPIVSHTGIYSHCETPRNFPDDLMQAIAAKGGVIGIGYWEDVTCDATPKGVARAIVAAINLVGADQVSLGSDYDGAVETAFDTGELAALTQALLDEGLPEATIAKVMGGNMMRYLAEALPE